MRRLLPWLALLIIGCSSAGSGSSPPLGNGGSGGGGGTDAEGAGGDPEGGNGEGGSPQGGGDPFGGAAGVDNKPIVEERAPATGMAIGEVSITQGVKVKLYGADGGDVAKLNAPIVEGRDALLRVFFAPKADWQPHRVAVRVTLQNGEGGEPTVQEIQGVPSGASTDEDITTSANFEIPGARLDGSLAVRVEMLDVETGEGDTGGTVWPAEGVRYFNERPTNGAFRLRVIPIRYTAGGVNYEPDLSEEALRGIRYDFLRQYPITAVDLSVGDSITWTQKVSANGSGWQQLLNKIVSMRDADPSPNVYYYGLFKPAPSTGAYCGGGCVAGLTYISPDSLDASLRSSIGLAFGDLQNGTMLHETGHAHRRTHAPCGPFGQLPDQIDQGFPYTKGSIGVWGYDLIDKTLRSPSKYTDFMGYCEQTWVSDYTFSALFTRIQQLNQQASAYVVGEPVTLRQAFLDVEGELRWGDLITRRTPPVGEDLTVTVGAGSRARQVKGTFFPMSHLPGGMLLLPADTPLDAEIDAGSEGRFKVR